MKTLNHIIAGVITALFLIPLALPAFAAPTSTPSPSSTPGVGLPAAEPIARYQPILDHSPFALATQAAPTPPPAENISWARDLVLTAAARLAGNDAWIAVSSRDQSQRFCLTKQDTYNGISIATIAWSDGIGKTKVTLKRGSEYGVIGFDEAVLRAGSPGVPANGSPGALQPPGGGAPQNPNPGNGENAAVIPIPIPNADASASPAPTPPPPAPNQTLIRRRPIRQPAPN